MKLVLVILLITVLPVLVESNLLSALLGGSKSKTCSAKKKPKVYLNKKRDKEHRCVPPPSCANVSYYRSVDGSCNNVNEPNLGMAGLPYARLCDASYSDGICAFPKSKSGKPLPNARKCSYMFSPEKTDDDCHYTILLQQFGQFLTHDMSLTVGITQTFKNVVTCCDKRKNIFDKGGSNPKCSAITIPDDDPVYYAEGTICLQFSRTVNTIDRDCQPSTTTAAFPISGVTSWIDLSQIYGSTNELNQFLREYCGGRLRSADRNGMSWLPQNPEASCFGQEPNDPCYKAGDIRVNQNPHLTVLQTIFLREHNRLCSELSTINPHWDDEKLFQEARRLLIAIYQHIVYYAYLPYIIGYDKAVNDGVIYPDQTDYVNTYDCEGDPSVLVEHASAAFRFFHTNVYGKLEYINENREECGQIYLRDYFDVPAFLEIGYNFDNLARGMVTESMRKSDQYFDTDITLYAFKGYEKFGNDVRAQDINRGRDHGLCSYVNARAKCGLPVPKCFTDLLDYGFSKEIVNKLPTLYGSIEDLDLIMGGTFEPLVKGGQCGETFQCLISMQFINARISDSFFYEDGTNEDKAFKLDQLNAIRSGASLSRIFCDNIDTIKSMQPNAFMLISKNNQLVSCDSLPRVDLRYWKDKKKCR